MTGELFLTFTRRLIFAFLLIAMVACATHAHGQTGGTVGLYTGELQIFSNQSLTASAGGTWQCLNSPTPIACPYFPDHGYATHLLTYCNTLFGGTIDLDWTPPGTTTPIVLTQATYPAADSNCHSLYYSGYFPNLRATVTRTLGTMSAWYSAVAGASSNNPSALGSNGATSPISCDQSTAFSLVTTGSTAGGIAPLNAGDSIVLCAVQWSFNGATSAGNLQTTWASSTACSPTSGTSWYVFTTSSTPQNLNAISNQRSPAPTTNQDPCFVNNSGATATVNVSWASVHGL